MTAANASCDPSPRTAVRRATGYEAGLGRPMVGRATMVACRQSATRQGRVRVHTLSNPAIRCEDGEGPEGGVWMASGGCTLV